MENTKILDSIKKKISEADAIVVGAASGMSASCGFKFYYQDDETYRMIAGGLREKYGLYNVFDAFYSPKLTRGEWWALVLRQIKYLYEAPVGEAYVDLAEILAGKNYYIVTTNQDFQFYKAFPDKNITRLQGDFRYFQCSRKCHDKIYNNKAIVEKLVPMIQHDALPDNLIPRCPKCDAEMSPWVRSREFLEGKDYMREFERYMNFLRTNMNKKVVFLELGVGMMTPMFIKEPFMNMTYQWPHATYITINPQHAIIPKEIADRSIAVKDDITFALKEMLGKPSDHLKRDAPGETFNPSRVY